MGLKSGYTTGTCVTIAARAAVRMIFEQRIITRESVITPKGITIETDIEKPCFDKYSASCAVKKYAGDDPDVTDGLLLFASVGLKKERGINIDGGEGVGRVTKQGLQQKIGEAAINRVPKLMIEENVSRLFDEYGYEGGADIIISVPGGRECAKKTFNPHLGIVGGISILGTSGIVEPMSERAIIDTIKVELDVKKANDGSYVMLAPGNYGVSFIRELFDLDPDLDKAVKCSNYIGETLDYILDCGFKGMLLTGHIGKLVKLAGGIMNTHSKNADCRMEIMAANTALVSNDISTVRKIISCNTTDEAISVLKEYNICDEVMKIIMEKALFHINNRLENKIEAGILMFSNEHGVLCKSDNADKMFAYFKAGEK